MTRVYSFSAGPAALPLPVLREIQDELLDFQGTGMSIMEMSHRSAAYAQVIEDAEATLRRLLGIPSSYRVLFLQGGATLQFAGIPLNLMRTGHAGYVGGIGHVPHDGRVHGSEQGLGGRGEHKGHKDAGVAALGERFCGPGCGVRCCGRVRCGHAGRW